MMEDIITIVGKEWKEILLLRGSKRSGLLSLAILVGLVGIYLPLQSGLEWLTNSTQLLIWSWMPLFLIMGVVADSFAGERERHTLETLLASRLSDEAILFGKIAAALLYGWGLAVVAMLLGALTVNLAARPPEPVFYPLATLVGGLVFSLLSGLLISAAGVLVSLRAQSTRQAYQQMSISFMILFFIPILVLQFLPPEAKESLNAWLMGVNLQAVVPIALVALLVIDVVLIVAARSRFRRSRLILD